jgi:actin-related protein 8
MDALTEEEEAQQVEKHDYALREIKGELKWRMKNAKRRAVPNAEGQVIGFNTTAFKETILDHNDPYKVEWIEPNTAAKNGVDYFVGEKVSTMWVAPRKKMDFLIYI